jgi:hypothetical protein
MASLPDKQDLTSARAHPVKMSQHLCLCSSPKQWSALFASIYLPRVGSSFGAAGYTQRAIRECIRRTRGDALLLAAAVPYHLRPFYNLALSAGRGAGCWEPAFT